MEIGHGTADAAVSLRPVDRTNWNGIVQLTVFEEQRAYVAEPAYYLALCCYGGLWRPLAVYADEHVIGFMMWAIDPEDGSCWLGGIVIDHRVQGRGYGTAAVREAIALLGAEHGCRDFALSYHPDNRAAAAAYGKIGFAETGERAEGERVARFTTGS
jgi:diamine N-acetyltransferase